MTLRTLLTRLCPNNMIKETFMLTKVVLKDVQAQPNLRQNDIVRRTPGQQVTSPERSLLSGINDSSEPTTNYTGNNLVDLTRQSSPPRNIFDDL